MNARLLVAALALVLGVLWVYAPVGGNAWVRYDDDVYVFENPHVTGGLTADGVRWAWTSGYAANWHPLTWMSHQLDVELFGLAPGPMHWMSVGLHALNGVLVLLFLAALFGSPWAAGLGAAAFALHPLRVESVAWIAERKDLLCGTFVLAALLLYLRYGRAPSAARTLAVVLAFVLALLAKPMAVTFPLLALGLDLWPLGRWRTLGARRVLLEKLPLFALAALSASVTLWVQHRGGSTSTLSSLAPGLRGLNALRTVAVYVGQSLVPAGLSVFYPHAAGTSAEPVRALLPGAALGALLIACAAVAAWRTRRSAPAVALGLGTTLVLLLPVLGLVQVGIQAHADRYTYLPLLGLVVAAVGGALALGAGRAAAGAALLAVLAFAGLARRQVGVWSDTRTLFEHALALDPRNYMAEEKLGELALEAGDVASARAAFERSLAVQPRFALSLEKLGLCALAEEDYETARAHLIAARALEPEDDGLRLNLGVVEMERGELAAAQQLFDECLANDPESTDALLDLGLLAQRAGRRAEAEQRFEAVLALAPEHVDAWSHLGQVRLAGARFDGAVAAFRKVLALTPDDALAHFNLGVALERSGDANGARAAYGRALELDPELAPARAALAASKSNGGGG